MKRRLTTCILGAAALLVASCQDEGQEVVVPETVVANAVTGTPNKQFWKQCRNDSSYESECAWITGNLNATHNTYAEGDFVPKVLRVGSITNNDPFHIRMTYGFLKGGLTTHDFLGKWNDDMVNANPCVDGSFSDHPACADDVILETELVNSNLMDELSLLAVSAACGGTGSQYYEDMQEAIASEGVGKLIIQGLNVDDIEITHIEFDGCPASGDAEAFLDMTITPTSAFADDIILLFGAHVARGDQWENGGAGGVNGSPYHLGLVTVDDESAGSMDLQMAANAIVAPEPAVAITIGDDGTNRIGDPHVITGTVTTQADAGEPFLPAPDGTQIDFAIESGPGSLNATSCTTTGGTGSCSVTLNSNLTGVTVVSASSTVGGLTATTDGVAPNSGNLSKTWIDAKISISPLTDLNPVGQAHTFTVTVMKDLGDGDGFVAAPGEMVTASQDGSLSPVTLGGTCTGSGVTDSNGQCTFTHTSNAPGTLIITALSTVTIDGVTILLSTDGTGNNSGPATKTWGNAWITIGADDTNRVDDPHTFTVTVMKQVGGGSPEAVSGVVVTPTGDTDDVTGGTCSAGTSQTGQCTIVVNSSTTGTTQIGATANVPLDGTSVTVSTDGSGDNSGPATKTWVDAKISISPLTDLNPVGEAHTFTVTVMKDLGDGGGFVAAPGETVTASQDGTLSPVTLGGTCTGSGVTDSNGQCTFTHTSNDPGTLILTASSTVVVGDVSIQVSTDGTGNNSGPATKTWGGAWITIGANDTNEVGDPHTFTVTVMRQVGSGAAEPVSGVAVTATGDIGSITTQTCDDPGTNSNGECTITVNSASPGQATIGAQASVPLNGGMIAVATDGASPNSGPATKTWVDARIEIGTSGTNEVGNPHTFTVTVEENDGINGWVVAGGETVTVTENGVGNLTGGSCTTTSLDAPGDPQTGTGTTGQDGQCTAIVNSNTAGQSTVSATSNVMVGGLSVSRTTDGSSTSGEANSSAATKDWVTARISIAGTATNRVGEAHTFTVTVEENTGSGFVAASDEAVSAFVVSNNTGIPNGTLITGGTCTSGTTSGSGQCTIVVNSSAAGQVVMGASSTVQVAGVGVSTTINSATTPFGTNAATGPATKTWVDAKISIAPDGENPIGQAHTFTVTVMKDLGDGGGFVGAGSEDVTAVQTEGAVGTFVNDQCTTAADGTCDIVVNSNAAGQMEVTASSTLTILGESVSVSTDGVAPNSGPATKLWFEICAQGERLTLVGLLVNAIEGAVQPLDFDVIDGNGQNRRFVLASSPGSVSVGDDFTIIPDDGASTFVSQNLRFRINGQDANDTVHLSCSDDPQIGDIHVISSGGISVTLEKIDLRSGKMN